MYISDFYLHLHAGIVTKTLNQEMHSGLDSSSKLWWIIHLMDWQTVLYQLALLQVCSEVQLDISNPVEREVLCFFSETEAYSCYMFTWSYRHKKHVSCKYFVFFNVWIAALTLRAYRLEELWWSCHVVMRTYDATYVTYIFRGLLSNNIGDSQAKPAVSLDIGGSFQLPGALANAIALWLVRRTTFLGLCFSAIHRWFFIWWKAKTYQTDDLYTHAINV